MLSVYQIKPQFQRLLWPLVRLMRRAGIQPNDVTVGALILSCVAGLSIALQPEELWPLRLLPLVLFVRMALNAMDGMLAREGGQATPLGALLNELGDVSADCVLYLPLALVPGLPAPGIVSMCLLAVVSEMAGVIAAQLGGERSYAGPMGKSDRALLIGTLGFFLGLGFAPGEWVDPLVGVANFLLVITIYNRSRDAIRTGAI
jgi:CDP-diacylglycerol--glycerol-3-phosphate 3-phosphatidyltransferase